MDGFGWFKFGKNTKVGKQNSMNIIDLQGPTDELMILTGIEYDIRIYTHSIECSNETQTATSIFLPLHIRTYWALVHNFNNTPCSEPAKCPPHGFV
jgi:hypothetical protein